MAYQEGTRTVTENLPSFLKHRQVARIASLSVFVILWWVASLYYPRVLLPGPSLVGERMLELFMDFSEGGFFFNFYHTLYRVGISFAIALVGSTALGIWMGVSNKAERFFEPYVLVGITIPGLAMIMISLLFFGLGETAGIVGITVTLLPLMTENMWEGSKNIDNDLIRMGHAFNGSTSMIIKDIVFPQLIPYILAATRYGLGLAWKIAVIAEMIGLGNGVGYMINVSFQKFDFTGVLAWTLSFTVFMFVLEFSLIKPVEEWLTAWEKDVEGGDVIRR